MAEECKCPPCPGRGTDGHGMNHCAECCFGTGVEADMDCPQHGRPMTASTDLDDTLANIRARAEAAWAADRWSRKDHPNDPDNTFFLRRSEHVRVNTYCGTKENADFLFHARTDVELLLNLLDQVTPQRDEIQANRDALARKVAEQRAEIAQLRAALAGADTTTTDGAAVHEGA